MASVTALARTPEALPRRLFVILHADMVGFSRLVGHDDLGTVLRLRALRRTVIDPALERNFGAVRQTAGDSILVVFDSIDHAVDAALAIQQGIVLAEAGRADPIRFRIGLNLGDTIVGDDDLYGSGINIAARLQSACDPGDVCVSRAIRDHAHQRRDVRFVPMGPLVLKNIDKAVDAFVIVPARPAGLARRVYRQARAVLPGWWFRKWGAAAVAMLPVIAFAAHWYMDTGASQVQREQVAALTAAQRAIAEAVARDKGVPLAVVTHVLLRLEESAVSSSKGEAER